MSNYRIFFLNELMQEKVDEVSIDEEIHSQGVNDNDNDDKDESEDENVDEEDENEEIDIIM